VSAKLRSSDENVCVSQRGFYLLRKGLTQTLGVKRRDVTLDTDLRSLPTDKSEEELWLELKDAVKARSWPSLGRPRWLAVLLWVIGLGVFLTLLFSVHWLLASVGAILVALIGSRCTRRMRRYIRASDSTLRKLVPFAVTSDDVTWTRDQVASLVKKLVIEKLDLKAGVYREDAQFVKDLGLN